MPRKRYNTLITCDRSKDSATGDVATMLGQCDKFTLRFEITSVSACSQRFNALRGERSATCPTSHPMIETPPLNIDRTLVLVGLMGAGKTTIGRRLAQRLALRFSDADSEIEAAAGCSISDIFTAHGEAAFREGERRVIARLIREAPCVLATGGGAFIDPGTRALIKKQAISVWLRADLEVLRKRVIRRSNRPLLAKGDARKILKDLMATRYPIYGEADIVVDSVDGPHDALVETVIGRLGERFAAAEALSEGPP